MLVMLSKALIVKQPYGTPIFCSPCSCSLFLFNTHQRWAPLVVSDSSKILYNKDGVTQGDPLSMFSYAVATLPVIEHIGIGLMMERCVVC